MYGWSYSRPGAPRLGQLPAHELASPQEPISATKDASAHELGVRNVWKVRQQQQR